MTNPDFNSVQFSAEDRKNMAENMAYENEERSIQAGYEARGWGQLDIADGLPMARQSNQSTTPVSTEGATEVFLSPNGSVTLASGVETSLEAAIQLGMVRKTMDGRHYDVSKAATAADNAARETSQEIPQEFTAPPLARQVTEVQDKVMEAVGPQGYEMIIDRIISGGDAGQAMDSLAADRGVHRGELAEAVETIHGAIIKQAATFIGNKFGNQVDFNAFVNWTETRMSPQQRSAMMTRHVYGGDMSAYEAAVRAHVSDTLNLVNRGVTPAWLT